MFIREYLLVKLCSFDIICIDKHIKWYMYGFMKYI